jgi:hypothetical protein
MTTIKWGRGSEIKRNDGLDFSINLKADRDDDLAMDFLAERISARCVMWIVADRDQTHFSDDDGFEVFLQLPRDQDINQQLHSNEITVRDAAEMVLERDIGDRS